MLLLAKVLFLFFANFSFAGKPPISSFAFIANNQDYSKSSVANSYGIPCDITTMPMEGVDSIVGAKDNKIQHNATARFVCKTDEGYYSQSDSASSYNAKCINGSLNTSSMCVKKCKLDVNEFSDPDIVKGRDVSNISGADQYVMKGFQGLFDSSGNAMEAAGGYYYVKFGDTVKVQCPQGFPPYHSDTAIVAKSDQTNRTFATRCLPTSTTEENKWSLKMACYNGFKPCDNSQITVTQENRQCNADGCFFARGGQKLVPDGYTPHGGTLLLDCSNVVYKNEYVAPKCVNGVWSNTIAYCVANYCTPTAIKENIGETTWKIGYVKTDTTTKIYHKQSYTFQCGEHNRIGLTEGKNFMCTFGQDDTLTVMLTTPAASKYCVKNACRIGINGIDFSYISGGESYTQTQSVSKKWVSCWGVCGASAGGFYGDCKRTLSTYTCSNKNLTSTQDDETEAWKASGVDDRGYGSYGSNKGAVDSMMAASYPLCEGSDNNRARQLFIDDYDDYGWYDGYKFTDSDWKINAPRASRVLCNSAQCRQDDYTVTPNNL